MNKFIAMTILLVTAAAAPAFAQTSGRDYDGRMQSRTDRLVMEPTIGERSSRRMVVVKPIDREPTMNWSGQMDGFGPTMGDVGGGSNRSYSGWAQRAG